jgi:tetratricopeptide (TPR) repeat protein
MGLNNLYLHKYQDAEIYFNKSENIIRGQRDNISEKEIAIVLNNIGVLYVKKGNMDEAFDYFKQAILMINKKDKFLLSIYNNNNSCYHKLKKIK